MSGDIRNAELMITQLVERRRSIIGRMLQSSGGVEPGLLESIRTIHEAIPMAREILEQEKAAAQAGPPDSSAQISMWTGQPLE